jgi:glycosyltransferase involved in cell wall biosynthesis
MHIAYISPYQGPELLVKRPTLVNLSLACNMKTEVVSELLRRQGHSVEIVSPGQAERQSTLKFYRGFAESTPVGDGCPVFYPSCIPLRFVTGWWSALRTLALFKARHRVRPFDLVIIYNLKLPQLLCARYARHLGLPVVLDYEDDEFVDVDGSSMDGRRLRGHQRRARLTLSAIQASFAVSPHLLAQVPEGVPKLLLRGVLGDAYLDTALDATDRRSNWVAFSGTHSHAKGLKQLITAWKELNLPGWELHIAGHGELTSIIQKMASGVPTIIFRGMLDRVANARFLAECRIGMNPHDLSQTPGNVFATKIVEYLAAGTHVISTRMGHLEPDIESGITYIDDNAPQTILRSLGEVITQKTYRQLARAAAVDLYGPAAVSKKLQTLLHQAAARNQKVRLN